MLWLLMVSLRSFFLHNVLVFLVEKRVNSIKARGFIGFKGFKSCDDFIVSNSSV